MYRSFERLEEQLKSNGADPDAPGFRQKLADEISDDPQEYNADYVDFFAENASLFDLLANEYPFRQNVVEALEAVWDYEVADYISANEINAHKRWVIDTFFKNNKTEGRDDRETAIEFVDLAADDAIHRLACFND